MSITLCMFARTLTNCDFLGLKKADLDIVLDRYPQLREQVTEMAIRTRNSLQGGSGCFVQTSLHTAETQHHCGSAGTVGTQTVCVNVNINRSRNAEIRHTLSLEIVVCSHFNCVGNISRT